MIVKFNIESSRGFKAFLVKKYSNEEEFNEESSFDLENWASRIAVFNNLERTNQWIEILEKP